MRSFSGRFSRPWTLAGVLTAGCVFLLFGISATALAEDPRDKGPPEAETQDPAADSGEPPIDCVLRLRGRFLDEASEPGDVGVQRLSLWSDTRIGSRIQVRATYDVGAERTHDLWAQYDLGGGFRVRAGRSAPLWLPEFTDPPFGFQMVRNAVGSALTQIRESGVFLFFDRAAWNARLHVVNGSGWAPDDNSFKDIVASTGRSFAAGRSTWKFDIGHYEGRDGDGDAQTPRRQSGVHLDADFGSDRYFRAAFYRRDQYGQDHFGGFARVRQRFPVGVWGALELGSESNNEAEKIVGTASYFLAGVRFELPWTNSHLAADYRRRFGIIEDNEILMVFQWILDFTDPRR